MATPTASAHCCSLAVIALAGTGGTHLAAFGPEYATYSGSLPGVCRNPRVATGGAAVAAASPTPSFNRHDGASHVRRCGVGRLDPSNRSAERRRGCGASWWAGW
jgi:hypothetical protein